jgi:hypothetical protein
MTADVSELSGYSLIQEPSLVFATGNLDLHPLRGLINNGPFSKPLGVPARVRLAQLTPKGLLPKLDGIVGELGRAAKPREALNYYPTYPGFEPLFRAPIGTNGNHLRIEMPGDLDALARTGNRLYLARHIFDAIAKSQ